MRPIVLCFSGHDPTGGSGVQADIESIGANGGRAMTVITASTVQNTESFTSFKPGSESLILEQANAVLAEFQPQAIKIGMLANFEIAKVVGALCQRLKVSVVLDPVLKSGTGSVMGDAGLIQGINKVLPYVTVLTPNIFELGALGGADGVMTTGCENILLTTTDSNEGDTVCHSLYNRYDRVDYKYPRLPGSYHGSGCTLAASLAASLGCGLAVKVSVKKSLDYTWHSLNKARNDTGHQILPNRYD
jgi:hydroxymethylpyrimidine/phosphomethylpyrimidine kinase